MRHQVPRRDGRGGKVHLQVLLAQVVRLRVLHEGRIRESKLISCRVVVEQGLDHVKIYERSRFKIRHDKHLIRFAKLRCRSFPYRNMQCAYQIRLYFCTNVDMLRFVNILFFAVSDQVPPLGLSGPGRCGQYKRQSLHIIYHRRRILQ